MGFFDGLKFADILTPATSLFGGLLSSIGAHETNKTNLKIARETNQANRANQEYQNAWNLNMWNMQNEYNSPLAKRQRLEAAGLNPIFYGLDGAGNAGSLQSAPFTAVNGAPMLNEGAPMGESLANLGKTLAEIELMRSQAKKNDSERALTDVETETKKLLQKGEIEIQGVTISNLRKVGEISDETIKNLVAERDKLTAEANEIQDRITSRARDLDIREMTARADKAYKEAIAEIERQKISQRDKEIEISRQRLAFDIAIGWARKSQADRSLDIQQGLLDNDTERTNWYGSQSYSNIQNQSSEIASRDALLPYLITEITAKVKNLDADTALKYAKTAMSFLDAIIPG